MTYPGQGNPNDPANNPQWQQQSGPGQPTPPGQNWQPQQQWQQPQQQWQAGGQPPQGGQYQPTAQFPQQQYQGQGQYQQVPPGGQPGGPQGPQQRKSKRGLIIGLVVALVAVLGGVATWIALSLSGGDSGADSPGEAAHTMLAAMQQGDVVGMMDSLAPAEAAVLSDMVTDYVNELKRIQVLDSSADPEDVSGVTIEETEELVFDDSRAKKINDRLTMAALVDGTLRVSSNFDDVPLAKSFKDAVITPAARAELAKENINQTVDIGEAVKRSGQPLYIATVNVDGKWYPSLFYTAAYYAVQDAGKEWPANPIPAVGADSPNAALMKLIDAIRTKDVQKVIEILPPDEMAVLHDVGQLLVEEAGPPGQAPLPFDVTTLETDEEEVTGGTRLTLRKLEITVQTGSGPQQVGLVKDGDCYTVIQNGRQQGMCADDLGRMIRAELEGMSPQASDAVAQIVQNLYTKSLGVVTVEVDGKHYVSPLRTYSDLGVTMLKAVEPQHVQTLIEVFGR